MITASLFCKEEDVASVLLAIESECPTSIHCIHITTMKKQLLVADTNCTGFVVSPREGSVGQKTDFWVIGDSVGLSEGIS